VSSCCASPTRRDAGFSLIEVLVALAIIGLALGATAGVFATGRTGHETAADVDTALAVAHDRLAAAEIPEALRPGRTAGNFAGRFDWQLAIAPFDDPDAAGKPEKSAGLRLFRIEVTVGWRDGRRHRQLSLATLRLGPPPP